MLLTERLYSPITSSSASFPSPSPFSPLANTFDYGRCSPSATDGSSVCPHTGEFIAAHEDEWTWEDVKGVVAHTNTFYVHD